MTPRRDTILSLTLAAIAIALLCLTFFRLRTPDVAEDSLVASAPSSAMPSHAMPRRVAPTPPKDTEPANPTAPTETPDSRVARQVRLDLTIVNGDAFIGERMTTTVDALYGRNNFPISVLDVVTLGANHATRPIPLDVSQAFAESSPSYLKVRLDLPSAMPADVVLDLAHAPHREENRIEVYELRIRLEPASVIVGSVASPDAPVDAASIYVYGELPAYIGYEGDAAPIATGRSNAECNFSVRFPKRSGQVLCVATAPGFAPAGWKGALADRETTDVGTLRLTPGCTVSGVARVGDRPLSGTNIVLGDRRPYDDNPRKIGLGGSSTRRRTRGTNVLPRMILLDDARYDVDLDHMTFHRDRFTVAADAEGRFAIHGVDPGKRWVSWRSAKVDYLSASDEFSAGGLPVTRIHPDVTNALNREIDVPCQALDLDLPIARLLFDVVNPRGANCAFQIRRVSGAVDSWSGEYYLRLQEWVVADAAYDVEIKMDGYDVWTSHVVAPSSGATLQIHAEPRRKAEAVTVLLRLAPAVPGVGMINANIQSLEVRADSVVTLQNVHAWPSEKMNEFRIDAVEVPRGRARITLSPALSVLTDFAEKAEIARLVECVVECEIPRSGDVVVPISFMRGGRLTTSAHSKSGVAVAAMITALDADGRSVDLGYFHSTSGDFVLFEGLAATHDHALRPGGYTITFAKDGWATKVVPVVIEAGKDANVDVVMEETP